MAEVEALREIAAEVADRFPGKATLDAFGDGLETESVRQADERADDRVRPAPAARLVKEHGIDLHLVERQHADRCDGGRAPEVVEREAHSEIVETVDDGAVQLRAGPGARRHDLDRQPLRGDGGPCEELSDPGDERRVVEHAVWDIDRSKSS